MTLAPRVSVVMPTYNRAALLGEAIASVRAQTMEDWECLVVDDGSTDGTADLLARVHDARVRVLRRAHDGDPARVRNAGLAEARGTWVAFLDDDDLWLPEKLATQLPLLEAGARWSYTGFAHTDLARVPRREFGEGWITGGDVLARLLALEEAVALPTVVAERALLGEAGGFDASLPQRHDYDLWLALAARARPAVTPRVLCLVRSHAGNAPRDVALRHLRTAAVYRKWRTRLEGAPRALCARRESACLLRHAAGRLRALDLPAALRFMTRAAFARYG